MGLRHVVSSREDVKDLWEAADDEITALTAASIGKRSRALDFVWSGAGAKEVQHKLGRAPTRWIVVDKNTAAFIHRTAWSSTTLTLQASAACTAVVMVW